MMTMTNLHNLRVIFCQNSVLKSINLSSMQGNKHSKQYPQNWLWLNKNKLAEIEHEGVSYLLAPAQKKTNQSFSDIILAIYRPDSEIFIGFINQPAGCSLLPALSRIIPQNKIQINCVKQIDSQDPKFVKLLWQPNQSDRYDIVEINFFDKEAAEGWSSVLKKLSHNQKNRSIQEICQSFIKDIKVQNIANIKNFHQQIAESSIQQKASSKQPQQNKDDYELILGSQKKEQSKQPRSVQIVYSLHLNQQGQLVDYLASSAENRSQNISQRSLIQRNVSQDVISKNNSGDEIKQVSVNSNQLVMAQEANQHSSLNNNSFEKILQGMWEQFLQQLQLSQSSKDPAFSLQNLLCNFSFQKQPRQKLQKQIQALKQANQKLQKTYEQLQQKLNAQIRSLGALKSRINKMQQNQQQWLKNKLQHSNKVQRNVQMLQKCIKQTLMKKLDNYQQNAVKQINDSTQALNRKIQETSTLNAIYKGDILECYQPDIKFLRQTLEEYIGKKIKKMKRVFQYIQENPQNDFHKCVGNKRDIMFLLKTKEVSILAGYIQTGISKDNLFPQKGPATQKGIIISFSNKKTFILLPNKKCVKYDESLLEMGNYDLRIKVKSHQVFSNYGNLSSFSNQGNINFISGVKGKAFEAEFVELEFHQLIYQK